MNNKNFCYKLYRKAKGSYKFYVAQCYQKYNRPCSDEVLSYVEKCLKESTEKANKKYLAKTQK